MKMDKDSTSKDRRILVIDDESVVGISCERILSSDFQKIHFEQDPKLGFEEAVRGNYDIILIDLVMPDLDGITLLKQLKTAGVSSEIVIMTGYSTIPTAVEAIKEGAAEYISKPFTPDELRITLRKVIEHSELVQENLALRAQLKMEKGFEGIIGQSPRMEQIFSIIKQVAPTDGTVLITGESGTGKEMVARAIHKLSPRKDHPFLACDCGSLAPTLLASELFGHVKGSFTGAISTKQGLFEVADKGTLFLDEISNISLETQGTLLRVLETRRVKKVGDTVDRAIDIRLISATNRDLQQLISEGKFREDLFYRLCVVPIYVPPLRVRTGDIPRLATYFLEHFSKYNDKIKTRGFSPEALGILESYNWPGNIRELKNMIERLAILCDSEKIESRHLPAELKEVPIRSVVNQLPPTWEEFKELKHQVQESSISELERRFLVEALQRSKGNVSKAAEEVGMQRTNFHMLMRKYGLTSDMF